MIKLTDQEIVDQLLNGNTNVLKVLYNDFAKITSFITAKVYQIKIVQFVKKRKGL